LAKVNELLDLSSDVDRILGIVQAVGKAIEVREELRTAGDLSVDTLERPRELVLVQRSAPFEGEDQVLDETGGLLDDRENVADLMGGAGSDLGYESGSSVLRGNHPHRMAKSRLGCNKSPGQEA
jgi:hypothetical protein